MKSATLSNGLRVVLVTDPRASEVQVTMRYQVGAVDDPVGQEGIAHVVEHLMFQQVIGAQSVFAKLEDIATSFNASTSLDATTYVTRASEARLEELLTIEGIRMAGRCASIADSVFARERQVVLGELALRDATTELLLAVYEALYPEGHPYRRRVSGTAASVGAITREQACAFAEAHYAPSNAVLVVSGPITNERLAAALEKFLAKIPKRETPPRSRVPQVAATQRRIEASAPIDDEALAIAWPLPLDPSDRATTLVAASALVGVISTRIDGVQPFLFGDQAAPAYGVFVVPDKETPRQVAIDAIKGAVASAPRMFRDAKPEWLAQIAFTMLQQGAIYDLFSDLEEGSDRDTSIAANVLAGRDPEIVLGAQAGALRSLEPEDLERIANRHFQFEQATIAVLSPRDKVKRGVPPKLATPVHDRGQRRELPEPTEAQRPYAEKLPLRPVVGMRRRKLANGLSVVLLPVTSVPTVEIRLVFGSGSADEQTSKRGAAVVAAKALDWSPRHLPDLLLFAAGGGSREVDVGTDHTAFTARGMNMHIDLLLSGLRRWVRDGIYDPSDVQTVRDAAGEAADIYWRASLFGSLHPYTQASSVSPALAIDEVTAFHERHHTPANATLVIAGRFDADLADKWIDYLFADWTGSAPTSKDTDVKPKPASIAEDRTTTHVRLRVALPAARGDRPAQLVTAAMLAQIANDVRHQLGASYSFDAYLQETRLASNYVMDGWVDASRATEAVQLLQTRLDALRTDPDTAARSFVLARRRVITNLLRTTSSARELADRVQRDIELERAPLFDTQTAVATNRLTIDGMHEALAELDISHAIIHMNGPTDDVDRAFAVLGRRATRLAMRDAEIPRTKLNLQRQGFSINSVESPLTQGPPPSRFAFSIFGGYSVGRAKEEGATGWSLSADVGYRFTHRISAGLHVSIGSLSGSYPATDLLDESDTIDVSPARLGGFLNFTTQDRLWGGAFAGASFVDVRADDRMKAGSSAALGLGLQGGYDVAKFSAHRLSVYGCIEADLGSDVGYASFTFGFGYRR